MAPNTGHPPAPNGDGFRLLVLDAVQDPGNVGTLLRAAAGLGAAGVVALPGTTDLWGAKVVRAGMGAHFALPVVHTAPTALAAFLAEHDVALWGADGAGEPVAGAAAALGAEHRVALALGNEGAGLTSAVRALARRLVAVPSTGRVESFNVAVAGSILLYELRPAALRAAR